MRFTDRVRHRLGLETSLERSVWANRVSTIKDTVLVNYYDQVLQSRLKQEQDLLRTTLQPEERDGLTVFMVEEQVRLKALCAARCALPAAGVEVPVLRELGFDIHEGRRLGRVLRIVGFPENWNITPVLDLTEPHAVVTDPANNLQLNVFYRHSIAADNPGHGYTQIAF